MNRRWLLAGLGLLGGGSVLPSTPDAQRREWPLAAPRSAVAPPRAGGPVLLVRLMDAAPGLVAAVLAALLAAEHAITVAAVPR